MPYLKLPDGEFIEVKQGMSYADAVAAAKERFPKLYAKTNEAEEGFVPSVRSGLEGLKSNLSTAVAPLFGTSEEATRRQAAKSEAKQSEIAKAPSWEDVKAAQEKYGLFGGEKPEERGSVSSALGMMRGQLGESIPQMTAVAGGARLGAMAGTPFGPVGTFIGGGLGGIAAGIPAFTGSGVQRQISEQEKAGVEKPLDYGAALTSAVPSAILDAAETFFVLGKLGMGKALTTALPKLAEKFGLKEAEATLVKTAERSLAATAGRGAVKGVVIEMPTEIAQGVLERAQAGLSLTDADARKEYESIAAGVVGPGAAFGVAGNLSARSVARERVADIKNERETQQLQASKIAQQAQDEQDAIAAAQGAKAAEQAQFRAQPKGTQLDMFGAEDTSPDQAMYPRPQRAFDIPEAPVQETPDLARQYAEAKQAAEQSANAMEAAHKANDNTAYSAARDTYDAASKQVNGLEATAAQQGVVLPVDVNALPRLIEGAASAVQKTEAKISKAREEGKDIKPLVAELEKQKSKLAQYKEQQNPVQGNLLDFNRLDAADATDIESKYVAEQPGGETTIDAMSVAQDEYSEQMAEQQRAKAREAAVREREQRFKDAEIKQASEKGQQLVDNASIESILVGQGKSLEETTNRRNQISALQEAMDSGTVNAEVQKLLGIVVPNNVAFDLTNLDPNAVGVKAIQTRREELELQRKTEFPNKKLVKDGALTKAGKKLIGIEATINELKRLEIIAKDHTLTGAESRLLGAASSSKEPALQKQQARFRADFAAKRRDRALFDFSNIIDSLRKGEFTGSTRNGLLRQAKALRRMVVNSTIKEAGWRRVEFDRPALTDAEKTSIKKTITTRLDTLAAKAEPTAKQSPTALSQSYSAAVERKLLAARAKGVSEIEYLTLDKELRKRQGSIERGMTISPNKNAISEYKKLQREISLLAYKMAFPKREGKKSVVKTEYTLGKQFPVKTEAAVEAAPTKDTATLDLFEEADKAEKVAVASKIVKGFTAQWNMALGAHKKAVAKVNAVFEAQLGRMREVVEDIKKLRERAGTISNSLLNPKSKKYETNAKVRATLIKENIAIAKNITAQQKTLSYLTDKINKNLAPKQKAVRKLAAYVERLREKQPKAKVKREIATAPAVNIEALRKERDAQTAIVSEYSAEIRAKEKEAARTRDNLTYRSPNEEHKKRHAKALEALNKRIAEYETLAANADKAKDRYQTLTEQIAAATSAIEPKAPKKPKVAQVAAKQENWLSLAKFLGHDVSGFKEAAEKTPLESIKETLAPRIIGTRTVETEIVPVKGAIAGTELGDIQKRLDAIAEVIHKYGARLGLDAKASMETRSTPANLSAAQQRINNTRLGLLEARDTLRQQMVMRVPKIVTPKIKTKATNLEAAADEAAKVIPREYAIATAALKDVSKLLNKPKRSINAMHEAHLDQLTLEKGKLKAEKRRPTLDKLEREFLVTRIATIQKLVDETDFDALTDKAATLVTRINDLKARAAKYDVDLSTRVLPQVTAVAQAKAMKEALAAEGRKAPIRSGPLRTGSPEQIAAKKEKVRVGLRQDRATLDEMEISQAARDAAADFIDQRDLDNTDRRDATDADVGVDLKAAQDIASRVQKALPKGVTFVYAPTLNDAPPQFHAALARAGKTRAKGAVMPDGTVVVIGEAHKNTADLEDTISHELIGHYGVDGILGKDGVQNLTNRLFAKGNQHVAEVATGLGVFPDVETALASLGYTGKPEVDMSKRRFVQGTAAIIAKPVMPTSLVKAFSSITPKNAIDNMYDVWDASEKWVSSVFKVIPANLHKQANDILHTKIHAIAGEDIYNAWDNQGENWVAQEYIEDAINKHGIEKLTGNLKRAYDVAVADIVQLANLQSRQTKAQAQETTTQEVDPKEAIKTSIVREMIAHAAEGVRVAPKFADKVKVFIKDMIAAVRSWMRSIGMSDAAKKDTKEIQALIRESSRAFVEGTVGVYVSPTGEAVFRDGHNTKPGWMSEESWTAQEKIIAKDRPLVDQLKGNLLGLAGVTQFVDGTAPFVAALNKGVAKGLISDLDATQARYNISAHAKRMNFTRAVATEGALTLVKKQDKGRDFWMVESGKGADKATLVKVFKALGKAGMSEQQAGRSFTMYLAALRTKNEGIGVEALNFGKDASGNPILTEKMLRTFEQEVNANPKIKAAFEEARGVYNEYNRGLIDFAVATGKFSKELGEKLKAKKDFIPFYRQIGGEVKLFIGDEKSPITIGTLKDQPYLHELVGGDTAILDIFTSAVQNTHMLTDMALRNLATKNVAQTLYKMGMLETAVSRDERKKEADTGVKAKTYAIRKGKGPASPDVLRFQDNGEDMHVVVKTEDTVFSDIPVELLVKGLEGVKTTLPAALELLGMPAKFLRRAVVLSPLYPVRQILRDSFSVLGTSGANFMPVITPLKNVYSALAGTNKTADTLEKQGLIGGQLLAGEGMEGMSTILRGVTSGKVTVSSMLAWAEAKSMQADAGVRVAAYNSFRKQGLNEIEAWVQSNELMDFNKRGISPSVYFANTLIPFFSAQIQGLNVFAKAMTGRMPYNERLKIKEKFYKRGMTMAALTLMYAAAMEDDDAYKNATPQQKYNNFFVRVPFFDEPLKIPIAFEYGLMFKAIPEAIFNTAFGKEEFASVAKTIVQMAWNSVPGLTPQAAKPFIEAVTGKDLFTSADIESAKELKLDPNQRYREDTTALGQMLGSIGIPGMSPVKVDHFIKSVGSQSLLSVVSLADVFLAGPKPPSAEMKTSKIPLIGGAFQPTDAGAIINRTYELMQEAEQAKNTYTKLITDGKDKEADAYLNANIARIGMGDSVAGFRNTMGEITKYEASVKTDKNMAPSEKRKVLDSARLLKIQVAKEYRDAFRSVPFRSGA